jgi:hypothetical protein
MTCGLVDAVGDGVSGCVDDVGQDARSDSCDRRSISYGGSSVG